MVGESRSRQRPSWMVCSSASKTSQWVPMLQLCVRRWCSPWVEISYVEALQPTRPVSNLELSVYRRKVPMGKEEIQSVWCLLGWSCLFVLTGGADWIEKVFGIADRFSSVPEVRCLIRSCSQLIPGADVGQCGVGGMPARVCPAGRKRSWTANFADK
jgi:hypothetical protein